MLISRKTMLHSVVFVLSCLITVSVSNTCNFNVQIEQILLNEGFHRNLTYEIVFNAAEDEDPWVFHDCVVGLDQTLPAGVYANPDELEDLKRAHKLDVTPKNRINIELPAEQSSPNNLYIMGKVMGDRVSLWVPVHARYHQAAPGGGMARNDIPPPRLYARCAGAHAAPLVCNGGADRCWRTYKELPYTMVSAGVRWLVPAGDARCAHAVGAGTALALAAGSAHVLRALLRRRPAGSRKSL